MNIETHITCNVSRESIVHALYEAAELEHTLMCTYLYAAFSLKSGEEEGLNAEEAEAVQRWRAAIIRIAVEEMGHLTAVWNITAALGAAPQFNRDNFPLDSGYLPANLVVKLAPFNADVLQHFLYLERPNGSDEPDGAGFVPERTFIRGDTAVHLTPMPVDYDTVGDFYALLGDKLKRLVAQTGEDNAFCGDPALQLSPLELQLDGAKAVRCLKTALQAFDAIVLQGEGAPEDSTTSHFARFDSIRQEFRTLKAKNPDFAPAHPAAYNPVLRRPPRPEGRIWIENPAAVEIVDLANAIYGLMIRFLGSAYAYPSPHPEKALYVDVGTGLMRAFTPLAEYAARMPAGPSHPDCNAGVSFIALRDAGALAPDLGSRRFLEERLEEILTAAERPGASDPRVSRAARVLNQLLQRVRATPYVPLSAAAIPQNPAPDKAPAPLEHSVADGVEYVEAEKLTLIYEGKRCIHARFCVTGAPRVFLANVQGPWIYPDAMDVEDVAAIARECPSGAIRYKRKDGHADEAPPPVNLIAIREAGPYAFRGAMTMNGAAHDYRATLCRCGASKNKPYCDSTHKEIGFNATGEPLSGDQTDMLSVRDGPLAVVPEVDGPLAVRGNMEITSGTGRVVARLQSARLCRCGHSANKPFCDNTHQKIGFSAP